MYTSRVWFPLLVMLCLGLSQSAWAQDKKDQNVTSTGDQAQVEIASGLFVDSEVGLLTYLVTDGSFVYRPGILVSLRIGAHVGDFTFYGKAGATVTGNTSCYSNASRCPSARERFPTATDPNLRSVPRQGVAAIAGAGAKWYFLKLLDDRFRIHLDLEVLAHIIPADNMPQDRLDRLTDSKKEKLASHLNPAFGVGFGLGIGVEYYFIIKHFSAGANARAYYFLTPFFENSFVGLALLVSVDIKYTFW